MGLGMHSLLTILEGTSYICNIIQQQNLLPVLFINSIYNNNKSMSVLFNNFCKFINNKYIINNNNQYPYGIFNKNIGHITASELNLNVSNNLNIINNDLNINYFKKNIFFDLFLNYYNKNNNLNHFNIFLGSHDDSSLKNMNVVLPGLTFLEKTSNYINIKGINKKTQAILPHEKGMRID